jgi:isoaspartyl peptidase/L-asparaginase-like protein (Ntn-hydrolase superfamily)
MARNHYTVTVQVQEVTPAQPAMEAIYTGGKQRPAQDAIERQVDEVVRVTTRADTKSDAVEKAVRMLEAEGEDDDGTE